jgi:hypothetical protein
MIFIEGRLLIHNLQVKPSPANKMYKSGGLFNDKAEYKSADYS